MILSLVQRSLSNGTATRYHALLPFHLTSSLFRRAPRSLQIPASPPNRVAFEPAALLFLYQGCCRHHNRHRSLCPAIIRLLLDTEKRCPRQLYKIGGKCRLFFSKFCRFGRLSVAQLSRKSMVRCTLLRYFAGAPKIPLSKRVRVLPSPLAGDKRSACLSVLDLAPLFGAFLDPSDLPLQSVFTLK